MCGQQKKPLEMAPIGEVTVVSGGYTQTQPGGIFSTEKHYAPWVLDRQQQLEKDVRRTWDEGYT